ncbi:MAG: 5,10-methylene tetrahydromethanopterin reductase [Deltaproteobacteria bacterium]|jgi:5,10-methylenetetrahydromethanopterin reductase|nr:5,10-methylene tetrahydromethanopterin reductase [Deltaproteobacteria bacterium]
MELSCSLPPGPRILEYARLAEELGYQRLWLYDSPLLYPDVWVALARVAAATTTLGLGPGVLVPGLRHVATTAGAIATLEALAPGRITVAVGTGFTARRLLGKPPLAWKNVDTFLRQLRGLLAGETIEIEGRAVRMLHPEGFAPPRPLETPILVAANGPRGRAVAEAIGDGIMSVTEPPEGFAWCTVVRSGTVLEPGETFETPRVFAALGPGIALLYHSIYEAEGPAVDHLPGGRAWREATEKAPEDVRHLHIHEGHCVAVPERELPLLDPNVGAMMFSGTEDELREKWDALETAGATELIYSPAGPNIPGELRAMARAVGAPR